MADKKTAEKTKTVNKQTVENAPLELCNLVASGMSMKKAKEVLAKRKAESEE